MAGEYKGTFAGKGSETRVSDHKRFGDNLDNIKKVREMDTSTFKYTVNGMPAK